ncbi:hypothetical protein [Acinetobacter sp. MD2(2019)]|uniref:hypothetical protein n=1 Tax=Acinetobacter sp. MD2(2019) TaxID=2605273 RepID=UPI002D1E9DA3|nr:hypothetical protein [Acinetobacter sp. MD2(2019)]MEB3753274.1 hypothetical protein [Acinetobacter sp. MD2(2019)]
MRSLFISCALLCSLVLVAGCQKKSPPENHTQTTSEPAPTLPSGVQAFAPTAQDAADIAQFDQFNQKFNSMSQDMKTELEQLKQQGQLSPEFLAQRKHDRILSALNMLKDLELHTEQGHYIQGLMANYWEEKRQDSEHNANSRAASEVRNEALNLMRQAEQQLDYWKSQQAKN